jgi:hypothetical protein
MKNGFLLTINNIDYFIVTNQERKTKRIIIDLLNKIQNHFNLYSEITDAHIEYYKNKIYKATLEIKEISNGRKYYDINGADFGGHGDFIDLNKTVIFE